MTSEATAAVSEPSQTEEVWASYELRGRTLTFRAPSAEQLMVMRRVAKKMGNEATTPGRRLVLMAQILDAVSALFIEQEDSDYADELVLSREVDFEELAPMIYTAISGPSKKSEAPTNGPTKPAKRVRRR